MTTPFDMDGIISSIERSLDDSFNEFIASIVSFNSLYVGERFSHRHADGLHALGINCFPLESNLNHPEAVSLIVEVASVDPDRPWAIGRVQWQPPSRHIERATLPFQNFDASKIPSVSKSVQNLLPHLQTALSRGKPPPWWTRLLQRRRNRLTRH